VRGFRKSVVDLNELPDASRRNSDRNRDGER